MLRHDLVHHTPPGANIKKSNMTTLKAEFTKKPLVKLTEEEMKEVHIPVQVHVFVLYKCVMCSTYTHIQYTCSTLSLYAKSFLKFSLNGNI